MTGFLLVGSVARSSVLALAVSLIHSPAAAQESLSNVLSFLLMNRAVATGDFVKDAQATRATRDTLSKLLLVELATLPLDSSSAGFTYRFNPVLGTVERASASFGSFLTERSLTAGRGHASVGVSLRVASYARLDGHDLEAGSFVTTGNQFRDEPQPFDVETLALELDSRILTVTGTLGITNRLDLGTVVPFVSLSLTGRRVNTYRGQELLQATADATSSGLGDIAVRAKYDMVERSGAGLAVAGEVRLPTGREEDLLGAGETGFRAVFIGSIERGAVGAHGVVSFAGGGLSDELGYNAALCVNASARVTLVGELVGRRIADAGRIVTVRTAHPTIVGVDTIRLITDGSAAATTTFLAGLKWNPGRTWLVNVHVQMPLTDRGLRSGVVTLVGLEYAVGR